MQIYFGQMVSSSLFFSQLDNNDSVLSLEFKMGLGKRVRERIQNDIFGVLKYLHFTNLFTTTYTPRLASIRKLVSIPTKSEF